MAMLRAIRVAPAGAAVLGFAFQKDRYCRAARSEEASRCQEASRFQELPAKLAMQKFQPPVPYPGWDDNWDYCDLDSKAIAKSLKHEWPIKDYADVIRKLYAEHTDRSTSKVDKLLEANADDLPGLYKRAFLQHAHGGGITRHIILIRHGQYEEQRQLAKKLRSENPREFSTRRLAADQELDEARVLTELGRQQAVKVGDRVAELLKPVLTTPGREAQVRIHVSTLTRAKETADLIASRLPAHVKRMEPQAMLVEGTPPAHVIPFQSRGGEEYLLDKARDVHIEGSRMEAAFRSIFYRDVPCRPSTTDKVETVGKADEQDKAVETTGPKEKPLPRHEYEIVVCHANVIRYFTLRALQLPPEAWLRLGGNNGSLTHLKIRPSGSVSLHCFGDSGHMSFEEVTFGMHQGLE